MRTKWLMAAALLLLPVLNGCDEAAGPSISGTLTMPEALQQTLGASDTLFVVAKTQQAGAPPVAVLRIVGMRFPMTYTITQEDVLRPNTPFQGELTIQAMIRKSGAVGAPTPGDMDGGYGRPVAVGARGVDIAIDQVRR